MRHPNIFHRLEKREVRRVIIHLEEDILGISNECRFWSARWSMHECVCTYVRMYGSIHWPDSFRIVLGENWKASENFVTGYLWYRYIRRDTGFSFSPSRLFRQEIIRPFTRIYLYNV